MSDEEERIILPLDDDDHDENHDENPIIVDDKDDDDQMFLDINEGLVPVELGEKESEIDNPASELDDESMVEDSYLADQDKSEQTKYTCRYCKIVQLGEALKSKWYCEVCDARLQQAYRWLQSPMLTAQERKKLEDRLYELTDMDNLVFD